MADAESAARKRTGPPAIATWRRSRATLGIASGSMSGSTAMVVTETERDAGRAPEDRIAVASRQQLLVF
jgi:hypothetical protein